MAEQLSLEEKKKKFLEAQKAREVAKKSHSGGAFPKVEIPNYEYLALEQNKCQVFRMLGNPVEVRKLPTDPIRVQRSLIIDDDNNWFNYIWNPDSNYPFNKLKRNLTKYSWVEKEGSDKKVKVYQNEGSPLLKRYLTNGKEKFNALEKGMAPTNYILCNVIDRLDSWCKENKHSKVIAWSMKPSNKGDGKFYPEPGMKESLYSEIFDVLCSQMCQDFTNFDIVVRRFTEKTRPNDQTNSSLYTYENKTTITNWGTKDGVDYYSALKQVDYLDEEDSSYALFPLENIPFVSLPTPSGVLLKHLGQFIKDYDKEFKDNIYEQLVECKANEMQDLVKGNDSAHIKEELPKETPSESEDEDLPSEVEKPRTPIRREVKKEAPRNVFTKDMITPEIKEVFPFIDKLTAKDLSYIKDINLEEQEIIWVDGLEMSECGGVNCGFDLPTVVNNCPICGANYGEDENDETPF